MAKLLIRKEEMILLKHSEVGKDRSMYGNLYSVLQGHTSLSESEFQQNKLFDERAKTVILNNKKMLFENIKEEWMAIGCSDEAIDETHCQLCGRINKWVFYIKNRINECELNVGSECIKKFPNIENVRSVKRSYTSKQKIYLENKRKLEFDEIDLVDLNYIKESEKWFSNYKILLPYKIYNQIKETIVALNKLRTDYVKNGGRISEVKTTYYELKKDLEENKRKADEIYEKNKINPLVCKSDLAKWLKENHVSAWESAMKNGGILNKEILECCYFENFIRENLEKISNKISDNDISIVGMNGNNIRFIIKNNDYINSLSFLIRSENFMKQIGCHCLANKEYTFGKKELTNIEIEHTNSNFNVAYNRMRTPMEKAGLRLEINQYTNEKYYIRIPRIVLNSKGNKRIEKVEIGYKKVVDNNIFCIFNNLIFADDEKIEKTFASILYRLNQTNNWKTSEEMERMNEVSKELSVRKQREFTPYV